jgi:hypothetical protein
MDTTMRGDLLARLEGVRQRFERWRGARKGHTRISDSLRKAAALMTSRYGISRTANALGVNYQALKKRISQRVRRGVSEQGINWSFGTRESTVLFPEGRQFHLVPKPEFRNEG